MKKVIALLTLFALPLSAFGQDDADNISFRLQNLAKSQASLEAGLAAVNAAIAQQKDDIKSVNDKLAEISSKIDALANARQVTLVAQPPTAWGAPQTFQATLPPQQQTAPMMLNQSAGDACAGGSCGSGRFRIFGRFR